jgi:hypothetical protein
MNQPTAAMIPHPIAEYALPDMPAGANIETYCPGISQASPAAVAKSN